jgi:hypothetical protein
LSGSQMSNAENESKMLPPRRLLKKLGIIAILLLLLHKITRLLTLMG